MALSLLHFEKKDYIEVLRGFGPIPQTGGAVVYLKMYSFKIALMQCVLMVKQEYIQRDHIYIGTSE